MVKTTRVSGSGIWNAPQGSGTVTFGRPRQGGWSVGGGKSAPAPAPAPKPAAAPPAPDPVPTEAFRTHGGRGSLIPVGYGHERYAGLIGWANRTNIRTMSYMVVLFEPLDPDTPRALIKAKRGAEVYLDLTGDTPFIKTGFRYRFYPGTHSQQPDPYIVARDGIDRANAFRGRCCVFILEDDFGDGGMPDQWQFIVAEGETELVKTNYTGSGSVRSKPAIDYTSGILWGTTTAGGGTIQGYSTVTQSLFSSTPIIRLARDYSSTTAMGRGVFRFFPETGLILANARFLSGEYLVLIEPWTGQIVAESTSLYPAVVSLSHPSSSAIVVAGGVFVVVGIVRLFDHRLWTARYDPSGPTVQKLSHSAKNWNGHSSLGDVAAGISSGNTAEVWVGADNSLYRITVSSSGIIAGDDAAVLSLSGNIRRLLFIEEENAIVAWLSTGRIQKIDADSLALVYDVATPYTLSIPGVKPYGWVDFDAMRFGASVVFNVDGRFYETLLSTGSTTTHPHVGQVFSDESGIIWDEFTRTIYHSGESGAPYDVKLAAFTAIGEKALSDFYEKAAVKAGYSTDQFRTINIPDTIIGRVIENSRHFVDIMRGDAQIFGFDFYHSFDEILAKRPAHDAGFTLDATITEEDLVFDGESLVTYDRRQDADNPRIVELQYDDPANDFEVTPQRAQKHHSPTRTIESMRTDIIRDRIGLTADHARQLVAPIPHREATAKLGMNFTVGAKLSWLEPSALVRFNVTDIDQVIKFERTTLHGDEAQSVSARRYLADVESTAPGFSGIKFPDVNLGLQETQFILVDGPLIETSDDAEGEALRLYGVIAPMGGYTWIGGDAWLSRVVGGPFTHLARNTDVSTVGRLLSGLGDPGDELDSLDPAYIEDTASWTVRFTSIGDDDDLTELVAENISAPGLLLLVGRNGRWEAILPQAVTPNANGTHTFSGTTYRGLAGTDVFVDTHSPGDYVVMIRPAYYSTWQLPLTDLDETLHFKATGLAQSLNDVLATAGVISGAAETPYAPIVTAVEA